MYNFQDSYGKYITTIYFVALVLMCALLFMNIIVAVLLDNYEEFDSDDKNEDEIVELEKQAKDLGK